MIINFSQSDEDHLFFLFLAGSLRSLLRFQMPGSLGLMQVQAFRISTLRDVHADRLNFAKWSGWLGGRVTGPQPLNIDLVVQGTGSKKAHGFSYKWVNSEQCRTNRRTSYMYVMPPYVSSLLTMVSNEPHTTCAPSQYCTGADQYQTHPRVPACSDGEGECNINFSARHSAFHVPQNSKRRFWLNGGQTLSHKSGHRWIVGTCTTHHALCARACILLLLLLITNKFSTEGLRAYGCKLNVL